MPDREKVIKGYECHVMSQPENCVDCPYREGWRTCNFGDTLLPDVYALLKEQNEQPVLTEELIKKVELALIVEGQQDDRFEWGEVIKYSPSEVGGILRKHGAKGW